MLAYLAAALLQTTEPEPAAAPASEAAAPAAARADTPSGAPADDYGFVAWCRGALTGHMDLFKAVRPEMARLEVEKAAAQEKNLTSPEARAAAKAARVKEAKEEAQLDEQQLAAGRDYIKLYGRALDAAEAASPTPIHARGEEMVAQGYRIWAAARAADDRTRMWSYIMWELPARCETAAKALETNSALFGQAFKAAPADVAATPPDTPAEAPAASPPSKAPPESGAPPPSEPSPVSEPATAPATSDTAPTRVPTIDDFIAADAAKPSSPPAAEPPPPPLRTTPKG